MEDLQLSVDERADKYILHLSEVYANEQESIVTLETEVRPDSMATSYHLHSR